MGHLFYSGKAIYARDCGLAESTERLATISEFMSADRSCSCFEGLDSDDIVILSEGDFWLNEKLNPMFRLEDVISKTMDARWRRRERKPEEQIVLSQAQKDSFVNLVGKRRSKETREVLKRFIDNPVFYGRKFCLERFYLSIVWRGDECFYTAHGCTSEQVAQYVNRIKQLMAKEDKKTESCQ